MVRFFFILVAGLSLASGSARAELCDEPKTQSDINYCAKYAFEKADGELNDFYGRLKSGYDNHPAAKTALIKSQRAWLAFRDAECKQDEAAADGGSAAATIILYCKARITNARSNQLQDRILCKEGDLSCIAIDSDTD